MGLKETVKRLEQRAGVSKELCPHLPPVILYPDGSTENAEAHDCGRPRLRLCVTYTDDSDKQMQDAAHRTFAKVRAKCSELTPEVCAEIVAREFGITPAELLERAA